MIKIEKSWYNALSDEFAAPYFEQLTEFVRQEYTQTTCYPPGRQIFAAFDLCPFDQVKVVIIGQDPYHGPGQAEGLCFSVASGVRIPPSLRNIFKEVSDDLQQPIATDGSLRHWAEQGVLLLNSTLTVREGKPGSHFGRGWEQFTDAVMGAQSSREGKKYRHASTSRAHRSASLSYGIKPRWSFLRLASFLANQRLSGSAWSYSHPVVNPDC